MQVHIPMEYLNSRLTRPVRISIMIGLIALFFIISPLVILYTAGYRYNWQTRTMSQTGVMSINAKPVNASVFINDVLIDKQLPIRLPNQIPGTYHIRIESPSYHPWKKEITVESKKTAYIRDIILYKLSTPELFFQPTHGLITQVEFSHDSTFALITSQSNENKTIELLSLLDGTRILVKNVADSTLTQAYWSPYSQHAVVISIHGNVLSLLVIDPKKPNAFVEHTYTSNITLSNSKILWNKNVVPDFWIRTSDEVITEVRSVDMRTIATSTPPVWFVTNETLWTYSPSTQTLRKTSGSREQIFPLQNSTLVHIVDINEHHIIANSTEETLMFEILDDAIILRQSIPTMSLTHDVLKDAWIAWSPWEVWSIHADGVPTLQNRTNTKIQSVFPVDEAGSLLFVHDNRLDAYNPVYNTLHTLADSITIMTTGVSRETRTIYFWGHTGEQDGIFRLAY